MFALAVKEENLELLTVLNQGIPPEVELDDEGEPTLFYVHLGGKHRATFIKADEFWAEVLEHEKWEPTKLALWRK